MPSADHSRQALLRQADWLASVSSPRVRTNSFPSCTFGLYTAISVWPLGFNLSCSLTRQHMPETVSVRKVNGLPRASFSRNLAVQALPLAMCLAPPPALRDFHPVEFAHAERTRKSPVKEPHGAGILAEWTGLEPATPGVTGRYSNQLNYHSICLSVRSRCRRDQNST